MLGRIEELEEREREEMLAEITAMELGWGSRLGFQFSVLGSAGREREELLSELVPAMEAQGYDTGPLETVRSG